MQTLTKKKRVLGFPDYHKQASEMAAVAGLPYEEVKIHQFPDGESKITLPESLPEQLIIFRSLDKPNEKLVELILVAAAARRQGCQHLTLVVPYLCYMRQDIAFHPGEVVSQKIIGQLLANYFDAVITVDSHLHRINHLVEAIPIGEDNAINLTATRPMAEFIQANCEHAFLIGPDAESEQWVKAIASLEKLDFCVAHKQRFGDHEVKVTMPQADFKNRNIVLVDDVASTGRTLEAAISDIKPWQPASISVLVTHALFVGEALSRLQAMGVENIWSCDSISHPTNAVSLAKLIAGIEPVSA